MSAEMRAFSLEQQPVFARCVVRVHSDPEGSRAAAVWRRPGRAACA